MKKKKVLFSASFIWMLIFTFMIPSTSLNAQDYSQDELTSLSNAYFEISPTVTKAKKASKVQKVKNLLTGKKLQEEKSIKHVTIDTLFLGDKPKMFLCQDGNNWVVFANEQSVDPIVCHGEGLLNLEKLKESPLWFLLTGSMIGLDSLRIQASRNHSGVVRKAPKRAVAAVTASSSHVYPTPLLYSDPIRGYNYWGQSMNNSAWCDTESDIYIYDRRIIYNKYCPYCKGGDDNKANVGCTAVAMAQVMWYWKWPLNADVPVKVNSNKKKNQEYNWSEMPGTIDDSTNVEKAEAVARVLRDCGYAGGMNYSSSKGSWMTLTSAITALRNVFSYTAHMKQYSAGVKAWNNMIKKEIANNRPVIVQATHDSKGTTHTFVIDGYDSTTEEYHINLGWWGQENGWYNVSGLDCYHHYTIARRMLYEITPNKTQNKAPERIAEENVTKEQIAKEELYAAIANDIIEITAKNEESIRWSIYDMYGNCVTSGFGTQAWISNLPNGAYIFVASSAHSTCQTKFIK